MGAGCDGSRKQREVNIDRQSYIHFNLRLIARTTAEQLGTVFHLVGLNRKDLNDPAGIGVLVILTFVWKTHRASSSRMEAFYSQVLCGGDLLPEVDVTAVAHIHREVELLYDLMLTFEEKKCVGHCVLRFSLSHAL